MLLDPPPGDWLMFRRTYDGQGHSPLDQITTENVGDLQLAWVWSMADGSNQPTPLVHDGIIYLANPGNIIQALDARTGDVIWQYVREFPEGFSRGGSSRLRNISIYEDKLFISTGDAALLALDARSGETVWEHQIADPEQGYTSTSGPMVMGGVVVNGINGCSRFQEDSCFITGTIPTPARSSGGRSPSPNRGSRAGTRGVICRSSSAGAATRGLPAATTRSSI